MPPAPRRLKAMRLPLLRRPAETVEEGWNAIAWPNNRHIARKLRAIRRGLLILLWTLLAMPVQALLLLLPGPAKVTFARIYWAWVCRLLGLRVRVIGAAAAAARQAGAAGRLRLQPLLLARYPGARRPAGGLLHLQGGGGALAGDQPGSRGSAAPSIVRRRRTSTGRRARRDAQAASRPATI